MRSTPQLALEPIAPEQLAEHVDLARFLRERGLEVDDAAPVDATMATVVESRSAPSPHDADAELEQDQEDEIGA